MFESRPPRLTFRVDLPGGQGRLREAALYVMTKCAEADAFGLVKLNKILWKADFRAYAARRSPVTGRQYQRLPQGPAPVEMYPLLQDMQRDGDMRIEKRPVGPFEEQRPFALVKPSMRYFSADDVGYLDSAIEAYWSFTGRDVSRDSHGVAWETRANGDPMPYDLALLSDETLSQREVTHFARLAEERGWHSE
jgi:hypothetical protein